MNFRKHLLTGLILLFGTTGAFAQHGGANGPTVTGALNPASGATEIELASIQRASMTCYQNLMIDMIDPFIEVRTHPYECDSRFLDSRRQMQTGECLLPSFEAISEMGTKIFSVYFGINAANHSPLGEILRNSDSSLFSSYLVVPDPRAGANTNFSSLSGSLSYSGSMKNAFKLNTTGFPLLRYETQKKTRIDPVTHFITGSYGVATQIKKSYQDVTPAREDSIRVLNTDGSESNFMINGKKFFECIESKL